MATDRGEGTTMTSKGSWGGKAAIAAAALALGAPAARAAEGFKTADGWGVSFDGFVNAFAVDQFGSAAPANTAVDPLMSGASDQNSFRLRTGLLPGLFAFNAEAPEVDGLKVKSRVGFYPQINNSGNREQFGAQVDLREAFVTVDGAFGQVLAGRALNLFQGENILTDMTLFGVGTQGPVAGGGTTAGRIGYGYVYTSFGAQMRYTTPDLSGFKLAVALGDPNDIGGATAADTATELRSPDMEAELSWTGKAGGVGVHAWLSGIYQEAWFVATARGVVAEGGAAGVEATAGGLDLLASGFYGKGIGTFFMLDYDALDATGQARTSQGYLLQAAYTVGTTKLGVSYGQNSKDETAADAAVRSTAAEIDTRRSVTVGVYHDLTKFLKLVAEYTRAQTTWFGGASQDANVFALGGFFLW